MFLGHDDTLTRYQLREVTFVGLLSGADSDLSLSVEAVLELNETNFRIAGSYSKGMSRGLHIKQSQLTKHCQTNIASRLTLAT